MTEITAERGHAELERRILDAGARWKRRRALTGVLRITTIALAAFVPYLLIDAMRALPPGARVAWLGVILLFIVIGFAAWIVRPLLRKIDPVRVAARIERDHPELGEELEAATELWEKRGRGRTGYSVGLIDALIEKVIAETAGIEFARAGRREDLRRWRKASASTVVACAVVLIAMGARLGPAVERLAHPFAAPETPSIGCSRPPIRATANRPAANTRSGDS